MIMNLKDCVDQIVDLLTSDVRESAWMRGGSAIGKKLPWQFKEIDVSLSAGERENLMVGKDISPEVIWPIATTIGVFHEDGRVTFESAHSVSPKEVRGFANIISKYMLRIDTVHINPDLSFDPFSEYVTYLSGAKKWTFSLGKGGNTNIGADEFRNYDGQYDAALSSGRLDVASQMHIGLAFEHYYQWSVVVGMPGGASVKFATTANGVKNMLSERDKGEGGRRDALRAWIGEHWRKNSWNEEEEFYVRKHLRGGETFRWRGFECKWLPSQDAVNENERRREERKQMGLQARRPLSQTKTPAG